MSSLILTYVLIGGIVAVCMLPFLRALHIGRAELFEPIYWASAYFLLLFGLRPVYDLVLGSEFLGQAPLEPTTMRAFNLSLLYALLGFCVFLVGYYSRLGVRLVDRLPGLPIYWDKRRLYMAWPLLLGLGFVSYFALVRSFGGWDYYICHKQKTLTAPGQGYLLLGVSMISISYAMVLTHSLGTGRRGYLVYAFWLPILLAIGFFSGSKGTFLLPFLVSLVAIHYLRRGIRFWHILGLVLFALLLFPVFNTYRHYSCAATSTPQVSSEAHTLRGIQEAYTSQTSPEALIKHAMSRFYGIDSLTLIVRDTPKVMGFQYGKTVAPLFVAWVPRQLWNDKPTVSFGKVFAEKYMGQYFAGTGTSAAPTVLGEAYLNWHLPGLLSAAFLSGVILRLVYAWLIQRNFGVPAVFLYSQIFLYLFTFWEASIAGLLAERIASLAILMVLVFAIGQPHVSKEKSVRVTN